MSKNRSDKSIAQRMLWIYDRVRYGDEMVSSRDVAERFEVSTQTGRKLIEHMEVTGVLREVGRTSGSHACQTYCVTDEWMTPKSKPEPQKTLPLEPPAEKPNALAPPSEPRTVSPDLTNEKKFTATVFLSPEDAKKLKLVALFRQMQSQGGVVTVADVLIEAFHNAYGDKDISDIAVDLAISMIEKSP